MPTQVEFVRVGIWVYPATHWIYPDTRLYRIPHTHSGRSCASGYFVEFARMGIWVYSATHVKPNFVYPLRSNSKVGLPTFPPAPRPLLHSSTSPSHSSTLPPFTRPRNHPRSRRLLLLCIVTFRVFDTSGHLGIPRHPLKSNSTYPLRSNSREWVFGYPHRIPYTHPLWSISAVDL